MLFTESHSRMQIFGVPLSKLLLGCAALVVGLALFAWLSRANGWDLEATLNLMRTADPLWSAAAFIGMALNVLFAAMKWSRVEASLTGGAAGLRYCVSVTAIGQGLGQFLPTPVASAIIRGLGNRTVRRSARHGAFASAWEQLFDLGAAAVFAVPAVVALSWGSPFMLLAGLGAAVIVGELAAPVIPLLLIRFVGADSALAAPRLSSMLWRASLLRLICLMLVTVAIARAMGLSVASWQIAAAVPPVVLAAVLSFVPAGIGVQEWSFVGLLHLAGVPAGLAAGFALFNRVLQIQIAVVLAVAGVALFTSLVSVSTRNARNDA